MQLEHAPESAVAAGAPQYTLWALVCYALKLGTVGFGGRVALVGITIVVPSFLMVVPSRRSLLPMRP